nr:MAG TPA: hypothetical protein [Caudoviricetes sp.]
MLCALTLSPPISIQICKSFARYLWKAPAAYLKLRLLSFFGFCFQPDQFHHSSWLTAFMFSVFRRCAPRLTLAELFHAPQHL